ncbi:MAG: ABC transporter substrate-binding protein [Candidatus Thermoplasmatota archaeon]|nr:ABC transporter substrate-binding protein [Candidatus Thermoplasmatota archaeon]
MTTQRQLLVLLMTTLMLGTGLAGCLGGGDGDEPETNPDTGGDNGGEEITFSDSDGDGIYDIIDQCADTPAGTEVDFSGCALAVDTDGDGVPDDDEIGGCTDSSAANFDADATDDDGSCDADGDGVADSSDNCPGTLSGTEVDASGCEVIYDEDNDGVPDEDDDCQGTASGVEVDANGCPVPQDSDGDGVLDSEDQCPNTPSGITIDETGCEVIPVETIEVKIGVLTPRTGDSSHLSEGLENAAQLAIDEINAAQSTYEFSLVFFDTQSSASKAHQGTWSLIEGDGVSGIVGGSSMSILQQGLTKPIEHQIPIITPFVSDGGLEEVSDDGLIWRVIPSDSDSTNGALMWSEIYELDNLAVFHVDTGYGRSSARIFTESYDSSKVCATLSFPNNPTDSQLETARDEAVNYGCENAVILANDFDSARLIAKIKGALPEARVVVSHHAGYAEFPELLSPSVRNLVMGVVGANVSTTWTSPLQSGFDTDYQTNFGSSAPGHAGSSYDATMIMAQAVIQAGSSTGSDVQASISNVGTNYAGIGGTITFDSHGNTPRMMYDLFRFEDAGDVDNDGEVDMSFEEMGYWNQWNGISSQCRDDAASVVIGMLSPQTGIHSAYAQGEENGVQLGVDLLNINQRGTCFSLTIADTESTESGAANAMQALVNAGVIGVIGPHSTEEALGALPIGEANNVAMISFGAFSNEALEDAWSDCGISCTPSDYGYLWRVSPGQDHHVSALSAHISFGGYSNVAILNDAGKDNSAIASALSTELGSTCSEQSFTPGQSDFSTEISALTGCDAVVILAESTDGAAILAEMHTQSLDIAKIGGHGMGDRSLESLVTDPVHLDNLTGIRMGIDHDTAEYDHELKYVYMMNYGTELDSYAAWAGDAALIMGTAALLADVGSNTATPQTVNELGIPAAAEEYPVSSGEITLSTEDGETNHTNLDVYHWGSDGMFTEIGRWRLDLGLVMF